jgi:hypothetical protein
MDHNHGGRPGSGDAPGGTDVVKQGRKLRHRGHHHSGPRPEVGRGLDRLAVSATVHCLTGCSIGEVLGMILGTTLRWGDVLTVAISIALAFVFGYTLTLRPLLRAKLPLVSALRLALASDTLSIAVMEIIDNAVMVLVPGAMDAPIHHPRFWGTLVFSLVVAGIAAYPVNRWLIARGRGHVLVHRHHS